MFAKATTTPTKPEKPAETPPKREAEPAPTEEPYHPADPDTAPGPEKCPDGPGKLPTCRDKAEPYAGLRVKR